MVGAVVGATALTVGAAVAATSPVVVASPSPAGTPSALSGVEPAPRVDGYSILRPSSLVVDTPSGLRIFAGTGMRVTGLPEPDAFGPKIREFRDRKSASSPPVARAEALSTTTLDEGTVVLAATGLTEELGDRVEKKRNEASVKSHDREAKKRDREAKKHDREAKKHDREAEKRDREAEKRDREAEKRDEKEARRRGEDRGSRA